MAPRFSSILGATQVLVATGVFGVSGQEVAKQVLTTSWWPAGTEKTAESVGILSHNFVYMTAMMEMNDTIPETLQAELSDVRDIAAAGGVQLADLVDCLANAPPGGAAAVRAAFLEALPVAARASPPSLTVVEMPGEYSFFNVSVSCIAARPAAPGAPSARRVVSAPHGARGVAANGLLYIEGLGGVPGKGAEEETAAALQSSDALIRAAGGAGLKDLVDCTAFVATSASGSAVRKALAAALPAGQRPPLTVIAAGLPDPKHSVLLRCTAALASAAAGKVRHSLDGSWSATDRFVFTAANLGKLINGTDAFTALEEQLKAGPGLGLGDVINCLFFIRDQEKVFDLFKGFGKAFNEDHPPPPSRGEFQAGNECEDCQVAAKCIAALPVRPASVTSDFLAI